MAKEKRCKMFDDLARIRVDLRILSGHITDILPEARRVNQDIYNMILLIQTAADQDELHLKYFQEEMKNG